MKPRLLTSGPLRAGSLCSGYGGLEMGAELVLGPLRHVWHGEFDDAPSRVLAHRWPGTPNLGDIAAVTAANAWADLDPIDLLFAGYPCQPFSDAGLRRGLDDPRDRWPDVAAAIRALRPRVVFLENVRGHLNRGFDTVVASLAAMRYVGRWRCVRASDAGAAHRRERLFIVAWPQEEAPPRLPGTGPMGLTDDVPLLPTPTAERAGYNQGGAAGRVGPVRPSLDQIDRLLPTPKASDGTKGGPNQRGSSGDLAPPAAVQPEHWGDYAPAVARWENVVGRPAPSPTEPGMFGKPRLSPLFVEWLMGLPAGHVTDVITKRSAALKILGNGVVPQAAALALRQLLAEQPAGDVPEQLDLFAAVAS